MRKEVEEETERERRRAYNARLGHWIVTMRAIRGMTRKDLAERLEVPYHRLNHWEQGHCQPPIPMVDAMARVLEVTFEDVLAGGEPQSQNPSLVP
jgi:DNA-binding XRE family transcriptional regulator